MWREGASFFLYLFVLFSGTFFFFFPCLHSSSPSSWIISISIIFINFIPNLHQLHHPFLSFPSFSSFLSLLSRSALAAAIVAIDQAWIGCCCCYSYCHHHRQQLRRVGPPGHRHFPSLLAVVTAASLSSVDIHHSSLTELFSGEQALVGLFCSCLAAINPPGDGRGGLELSQPLIFSLLADLCCCFFLRLTVVPLPHRSDSDA